MSLQRIAIHVAVVVGTIIGLLVLWQMSVAVIVFLAALALSACMYPLVEHLTLRGWNRFAAIGITVSCSLAIVCGLALALAVPVALDLQEMGQDVAVLLEDLSEREPDHWLLRTLNLTPSEEVDPVAEEGEATTPLMGQTMRSLVGTATQLFELGAHAAICVALSVYWTIDRHRLERLWLSLIPIKRRNSAQRMFSAVEREVGAYLRNELAQGLLATFLLWAGFEMLGLRYAALAALVAAVLQMLPWLGNVMAVVAVLGLSSGKWLDMTNPWLPTSALAAVAFLIVVLVFLELVIEPRLFNRDRYNSFWTVLTTLALTFAFGVWGLLFGPAVGYSIQIILRQLHPLFIYQPSRSPSLDGIAQQLEILRLRYPREDTPPEVLSFIDRLEAIVESRAVALGR